MIGTATTELVDSSDEQFVQQLTRRTEQAMAAHRVLYRLVSSSTEQAPRVRVNRSNPPEDRRITHSRARGATTSQGESDWTWFQTCESVGHLDSSMPLSLYLHTAGRINAVAAISRHTQESAWILELPEDWDGEGSPPFAAATLSRATSLFKRLASSALLLGSPQLALPKIGPAERGSIDLYWSSPEGQLLINVPNAADRPPTYAWHGRAGEPVAGSIETEADSVRLVEWVRVLA